MDNVARSLCRKLCEYEVHKQEVLSFDRRQSGAVSKQLSRMLMYA